MSLVVSFGGGVNSGAMLIGLRDRGLRPDAIFFADTASEMPATYEFVEAFSIHIQTWNFPPIERVFKTYKGQFEGLEKASLRLKTLPGLAFGTRSCSMKYKGEVLDRALRIGAKKHGWHLPARKAIGYDAGEPWRAQKVSQSPKLWTAWYPLVEWGWTRDECIEILSEEGFKPPKSSCFFCPAMKKGEIIALAESHPEFMERALAIEDTAQANTTRGLGGTFKWREILNADRKQVRFDFEENPLIPCGCVE
jgi:hypothetical protein